MITKSAGEKNVGLKIFSDFFWGNNFLGLNFYGNGMQKKLSAILCIALLGITSILNAAFKEVSLNGEWDFTFQKKAIVDKNAVEANLLLALQDEKTPILPEESAYDIKLNVPDYLCFNTDRFAKAKWGNESWSKKASIWLSGIAFYRKTIDIPRDWQDKSVLLHIGRANEQVYLYINGKSIASYPYSYLVPSQTDLSGLLKYGEKNEIVIAVDNSKWLTYFKKYGGIVSNVSLLISNGAGRIENAYFRAGTTLNDIEGNIILSLLDSNKTVDGTEIKWKIKEWNQSEVLEEGKQNVDKIDKTRNINWEIKSNKIKPWSPNSPNLYTAEITWEKDGKIIDSLTQRFGIRKWSTECRSLKLNDIPIYLRQIYAGSLDVPHARYPQNDKKYWLAYFQGIKDRGYNSVDWRWHLPPLEAFEAADESGIIMQTPASIRGLRFDMLKNNNDVKERVFSELWPAIVTWTRTYPSMSIYCLGGEMGYYDGFIKDVKKINDIIKKINPESLLMPNQAMCGIEYNFSKNDVPELTLEPFPYHAKRLAEITECSDIFGNCRTGGPFSYYPFSVPWNIVNEQLAIYQHPLISHEVQESNLHIYAPLPDDGKFTSLRDGSFGIEYLCYIWKFPIDKETVKIKILKQDAKDRIYYENINRVHAVMSKYVFEKLRKCNNLAGYQDLGCCGGLNVFLENCPGYSPEAMRKYNNDSVLLLDFDNNNCWTRCYWENDPFMAEVMISPFAGKNMPFGELSWELKDGERVLARNCSEINAIKDGTVKTLETIKFNWPEVKKTRKLNLKFTFIGFGLNISNDWDFWVFKKNPAPDVKAACRHNLYLDLKKRYSSLNYLEKNSPEKLWVTDELTENTIAHLEKGGDVLLLGYKPFPMNNEWPTFNPGYRNNHTNGSVIYKHPVFENIPNEGWGDWEFYPLLEGSPTVVFKDERKGAFHDPKTPLMKDIAFNPILEIIHMGKDADFSNIFELKAGKGRLFVSTCNTDLNNPVCTALLDSILKYVSGPDFNPTVQIETPLLRKLLEGSMPVIKDNEITFSAGDFTGGTFNAKYGSFGCSPRDGISIAPQMNVKAVFELNENDIPKSSSSDLILAVDGQDCDKPGNVNIRVLLNDKLIYDGVVKCVKKGWSLWDIPFKKELLKKGVNVLEFRNSEKSKLGASSQWFMIAGATIKGATEAIINVKSKTSNTKDILPPVLKLLSSPPLENRLHLHLGTTHTTFSISAEDEGSGVKKIEISIDKEGFKPYKGPFHLEKGIHNIRCRSTDNAGNQTTLMKGITEEGTDADNVDIEIK